MKKSYLFIIIGILFILSACDNGLRIVGIKIAEYPNKTTYVIGLDDSLILDGGEICLITKDILEGKSPKENGLIQMSDEREISITHEIDFNVAGTYTITCTRNNFFVSFPVYVVNPDDIMSTQKNMKGD